MKHNEASYLDTCFFGFGMMIGITLLQIPDILPQQGIISFEIMEEKELLQALAAQATTDHLPVHRHFVLDTGIKRISSFSNSPHLLKQVCREMNPD